MKKKKNATTVNLFIVGIALAFAIVSFGADAKNENSGNKNNKPVNSQSQNQGNNQNSSSESGKTEKLNLKNYQEADESKGETNAQVHKIKTQSVVQNLERLAAKEENKGSEKELKAKNMIRQAVRNQEQIQTSTAESIEKVEKRSKVKSFFLGTDYKNLGQLKSNLVQNRNEIMQLTRAMQSIENSEELETIQEQVQVLMQERERIKAVVANNEGGFSLFGWVFRFMNNYDLKPISEEDESDLQNEVEAAISSISEKIKIE